MDIEKAFDRVDRARLLHLLLCRGVCGVLLDIVAGYLCDRCQRVRVGDSLSDFVSTPRGFPQGGVFSLFGFLVYMNTVLPSISRCSPNLFVDDLLRV